MKPNDAEFATDCSEAPEIPPFAETPTPGRNADGTFARGNIAALTHGARSKQVAAGAIDPMADDAKSALAERRAAIVSDLGGDDAVGVLALDAVSRYVTLQMVEDWLASHIVAHGPLTPKGRQRAALSALLQVSDRLTRLAMMLGVERRPKQTRSLSELMADQ